MGEFGRSWTAEVLKAAPLIAPARQVVWPMQILGEEDALARGALRVLVRPRLGASFLATCALGFQGPEVPTGIFACPREDEICALAGGYAYVADTLAPERCTLLSLKPVVEVHAAMEAGLLVFAGFHTLAAWGVDGWAWETERLSWEGVKLAAVEGFRARGTGWDLMSDREVEFVVDLRTGAHVGGGFKRG